MKNKALIVAIAVALVAGGIGFFGGMKHQQSKLPNFVGRLPQGQMPGQFGGAGENLREGIPAGGFGVPGAGFRPVNGTIISKDETSITVGQPDGGSKIVVFSEDTSINKTEEATRDDLNEGDQVVIFGQENSDGSVTAENVQIGGGFARGL